MRKTFIILTLTLLPMVSMSQNPSNPLAKYFPQPTDLQPARSALLQGDLLRAVGLYSAAVKQEQNRRTSSFGVDGDLLAEYAYALALSHNFDFALTNLDRARAVNALHADFYTHDILLIMGYAELAAEFPTSRIPDWLAGHSEELLATHGIAEPRRDVVSKEDLEKAYLLQHRQQSIRALTLLHSLEVVYPNAYIIPVVGSAVWESLGLNSPATASLRRGLELMDSTVPEGNKVSYAKHLSELESYSNTFLPQVLQAVSKFKLRPMFYVGATYAAETFSLTGRVGMYTATRFSTSLGIMLTKGDGFLTGSVSLSAYKTWHILVGGFGLSYIFSDNNNTLSLSPSVGFSFMDDSQKSSFDVMFNLHIPFSSESSTSYCISIGKTFYL